MASEKSLKVILAYACLSIIFILVHYILLYRARSKSYEVSKRGFGNISRIALWSILTYLLVAIESGTDLAALGNNSYEYVATQNCKFIALTLNYLVPLYMAAMLRQFWNFLQLSQRNAMRTLDLERHKEAPSRLQRSIRKYWILFIEIFIIIVATGWVIRYTMMKQSESQETCLQDATLLIPLKFALGCGVLLSMVISST